MKGSTKKRDAVPASTHRGPIDRSAIEAKFRELRGEVDQTAESARGALVAVGAVAAVGVVLVAFWFGRKRGKKRTTVVEIRRV